jgi:predicted nucleic acid-binding protein
VYLLDTNIFLEVLLNREYSPVIRDILNRETGTSFFITDFSLYSMGIFLVRRKQSEQYTWLLEDLENRDIRILSLSPDELRQVPSVCTKYDMDFDDAYQVVAADANNLKLVSLDHDFDRIPAGRMHPKDI